MSDNAVALGAIIALCVTFIALQDLNAFLTGGQ